MRKKTSKKTTTRNTYSEERKKKVVKKLNKGMTIRKVARIHKIPRSTVWQWGKQNKKA